VVFESADIFKFKETKCVLYQKLCKLTGISWAVGGLLTLESHMYYLAGVTCLTHMFLGYQ